jgi:four helix bundle protein
MRSHQDLAVFRRSDAALHAVHDICDRIPRNYSALAGQLRRAAMSVRTNIVEGSKRRTNADYAHFLNISEASAEEARIFLKDVIRRRLDRTGRAERLQLEYAEIALMLRALRRRYED